MRAPTDISANVITESRLDVPTETVVFPRMTCVRQCNNTCRTTCSNSRVCSRRFWLVAGGCRRYSHHGACVVVLQYGCYIVFNSIWQSGTCGSLDFAFGDMTKTFGALCVPWQLNAFPCLDHADIDIATKISVWIYRRLRVLLMVGRLQKSLQALQDLLNVFAIWSIFISFHLFIRRKNIAPISRFIVLYLFS